MASNTFLTGQPGNSRPVASPSACTEPSPPATYTTPPFGWARSITPAPPTPNTPSGMSSQPVCTEPRFFCQTTLPVAASIA